MTDKEQHVGLRVCLLSFLVRLAQVEARARGEMRDVYNARHHTLRFFLWPVDSTQLEIFLASTLDTFSSCSSSCACSTSTFNIAPSSASPKRPVKHVQL